VAADVFRQARKMVKDHVIRSSWTAGGTVYVRKSFDPSCKPQRIVSVADLQKCLAAG
jgi:hypothetical protein